MQLVKAAHLETPLGPFGPHHGPRQERDDFSELVRRFAPDAIVADRPRAAFDGYTRVRASGPRSLHVRRSVLETRL